MKNYKIPCPHSPITEFSEYYYLVTTYAEGVDELIRIGKRQHIPTIKAIRRNIEKTYKRNYV